VQTAIEYFKQSAAPTNVALPEPKKKKRKMMSPEARLAASENMKKMRQAYMAKAEAFWTPELKEKIRSMIAEGKTVADITKILRMKDGRVYGAIKRYNLK
jgi:Mor family transcriptional regulator